MKKTVWIVVGIVVIGAGILIGRDKANKRTTEDTENAESNMVSQASSLPGKGGQGSRQDVGGTEKGVGDAPLMKELSAPVKALLLQDEKEHNYSSLLAAINELDYGLSEGDVVALMEMLNFSNDQFPEGMRPIEINAVKNDVLDKLLRQETLPEGLGLQMVEMAGNVDNDPVWRDYCVQFMQPFYERKSQVERSQVEGHLGTMEYTKYTEGNRPVQNNELTAIHDAMFQALEERDSTIAGTSLIGLELLSRTHDEFDREMIVSKAAEIASDEVASPASRMTALRLSAGISNKEQGISNDEVSNAARSIAQTGETVLLRSAAIVTLGEVGSATDRELLESYLLADNKQIAGAAKMALDKMDAR